MKRWTLFGALLALMVAWAAPGVPAQEDDYGDGYRAGDYGRVRYLENGMTLVRAPSPESPGGPEEGTLNTPIFPGDVLRTARDQRVEIELAGGTVVRVDRDSELAFQALPTPYASFVDNSVLRLAYGSLLVTSSLREDEEFRVDTPAASVYLLGDGVFRLDVDSSGRARVLSRRGVAEVVSEGGSVLVRAGAVSEVWPGSVPGSPVTHNTFALDGFDRWAEAREDVYRARTRYAGSSEAYENLPSEVRPHYAELSAYGRWVHTPAFGHVWYPYDAGPDWRPYADGYWAYGPHGYFWVSYEPWGWAPYRYGRWSWVPGYGWCWIPGRVFAGAWVAWSWGSAYIGWAPLDYWNRPVFIGSVWYGYYDPGCWTFVSYRHIHVRHPRRYAVPVDERVRVAVRTNTVVTRAPRVAPRLVAERDDARARAIREVETGRVARVAPVARDRTPERNFSDVERRVAIGPRAGTTPPGRGTPAVVPRASGDGPVRARPADATTPRGSERPSASPEGPRAPAARPEPRRTEERQPEARGRESEGFPRRILEDPRTRPAPPAEPRRGREEGSPAARPRTQGQEDATNERVRDMYQRLSRPREARERDSGGDREPESAQPARPAPRAPSRAPETQRTRPQPAPQREQPSRAAPQREQPSRSAPPSRARPQPAPQREQPSKAAPQRDRKGDRSSTSRRGQERDRN
jgi:hypothetical protein